MPDGYWYNSEYPELNLVQAENAKLPPSEQLQLESPLPEGIRYWLLLTVALSVAVFGILWGSPQPRRATKWAWFWLIWFPLGLGALAYVLIEIPWSRKAEALPEPLPHRRQKPDPRLTAGWAFIALVIAGSMFGVR